MGAIWLWLLHNGTNSLHCAQAYYRVLCSYSTLPLYAIVTQMGSGFKKAIFDEHVQAGLLGWAQKEERRKGLKAASSVAGSSPKEGSKAGIQLASRSPIFLVSNSVFQFL
ncbi:hypothetical protein Droror1_Dr00002277 [Drosera rotundifolia]